MRIPSTRFYNFFPGANPIKIQSHNKHILKHPMYAESTNVVSQLTINRTFRIDTSSSIEDSGERSPLLEKLCSSLFSNSRDSRNIVRTIPLNGSPINIIHDANADLLLQCFYIVCSISCWIVYLETISNSL